MNDDILKSILAELKRLADAAERSVGPVPKPPMWDAADCFVWNPAQTALTPVPKVNRVDLSLIRGVDHVKQILSENTTRFANGLPANNVLLWGARGMGKSSLVKAIHAAINQDRAKPMKLVEVHREDISTLPDLMELLKTAEHQVILFCDDLSFDNDDTSYKSLKAALDGGVEGRPENVVFYATSNRRHLLPRNMIENEQSTAINPSEAVEEKVSLSDRFGLWLGFHKCSQDDYLAMIDGYAGYFGLDMGKDEMHHAALEWATTRGARSGRVAWQFIQDIAGQLGKKLQSR
ncbi:MAG: ATPase associated with various cellular family protein [Rhizobium sp.]|nr:ATPase associated with various cellular family protein [Rhizobium sp.]